MVRINKPDNDLLTVAEVARQCNVNPETVRRWAREDKIPAQRVGNMLFFRAEDIASGVDKGGRLVG